MDSIKLFISYSHDDEPQKEQFLKFLASLKRNGTISHWHDRELIAGDKLNDEIISNIQDADVVCFLITQNFLDSYYCVEVELREVLEKEKVGAQHIFPIIVDHSTWQDTSFKDFLCVPKDGVPILEYDNQSKGWLEVTEQLKRLISELPNKKLEAKQKKNLDENNNKELELADSFREFLNSTEVNLQNQYKQTVTLDDTFVFPDLKVLTDDSTEYDILRSSESLRDSGGSGSYTLLLGEEQVGKTTLLKMLYKDLLLKGKSPIYLDSQKVKSSDPDKVIKKAFSEQYNLADDANGLELVGEKILLLDNIHEVSLNKKALKKLIDQLHEVFDRIIVTTDDAIQYDEEIFSNFDDYEVLSILPLGYERRDELLQKWYSIGREELIEDTDLIELVDIASRHINSIIRKNIVPSKPIFVLMIIQTLESSRPQDYSLTSHGYCYQVLIQENLKKANIKSNDIDKYINYLTHISFYMYKIGSTTLSKESLEDFSKEYASKYQIESNDEVLGKLELARLFKISDGLLSFKYKYIFFFYVAKFMADSEEALSFIDKLCDSLHLEQSSNILIFMTHHTRSKKVIAKIIDRTTRIFSEEKEAELDKDETEFLKEFLDDIPELVVRYRNDVKAERKDKLIAKDKSEMRKVDKGTALVDSSEVEEISESLRDITRSVRSVEIIGQIIKNRYASIEKSQLDELAKQAINVGLRFLSFYLNSTRNIKNELVDIIQKYIEDHSDLSDEKIISLSKQSFIHMVYNLSFNVIRKISNSVGHRELVGMFNRLNEESITPAYSLINANIQLEFKSNKHEIPRRELQNSWKVLKGKFLAERLLKASVLQFQYINFISHQDKYWISEKLEIPLDVQDRVSSKKRTKITPRKG